MDTPENSKQPKEESETSNGPETNPSPKADTQGPSKPAPPKPAPSKPEPNPVKIDSEPKKPAAPSRPSQPAASAPKAQKDPSISFDDDDDDFDEPEKASALGLAIDGVAAAVTIAFTVLIFMDVLPFLK